MATFVKGLHLPGQEINYHGLVINLNVDVKTFNFKNIFKEIVFV